MEMGCQVSDNLRRAIAAFLLIGVSATTAITAIRQYSTAYMMVESSREYALVASFMVVGALVLAVMFPASSRWGFPVLAGSLVVAIAVAIAPKLGLVEHAPLFWRWALMGAVAFPIGVILSQLRNLVPKAKATESDRKRPKIDRKLLHPSRKQKALMTRKPPKILANPDTESPDESAESLMMLNETLEVVRQHRGNMAAAARELRMSAPGIGDRMRRLYKVNPEQVERYAPEWVRRNIKERP
jgi:MFS family permease